jgi:excisionase family DNA binding protein
MPIPLLLWLIATAVAPSNRRGRRHPDQTDGSPRRWATIAETAEYLRVSDRAVRLMLADGRLTSYRLGPRIVRIDLAEVDTKGCCVITSAMTGPAT